MTDVESREVVFRCARHPKIETTLRCGRCETPICPQCLVYTPVGVRCPDCGKTGPNPIRQLPPDLLGRAVAAGAGLTLAVALAWLLLAKIYLGGFFILIAGLGIGYGVSAGLSRAARWRRGPAMMAIAAVATVGGYVIGLTLGFLLEGVPIAISLLFTLQKSFDLFVLAAVVISVGLSVSRVR